MLTNIILLVASTIYLEAGGEGIRGRELVASVIWNRQESIRPPLALHARLQKVCLKPKQFSCWNNRKAYPSDPQGVDWDHCLSLAQEIAAGRFVPITTATHYFNPEITKGFPRSWNRSKMRFLLRHRRHDFYIEE